jgi:hypothetical protein
VRVLADNKEVRPRRDRLDVRQKREIYGRHRARSHTAAVELACAPGAMKLRKRLSNRLLWATSDRQVSSRFRQAISEVGFGNGLPTRVLVRIAPMGDTSGLSAGLIDPAA